MSYSTWSFGRMVGAATLLLAILSPATRQGAAGERTASAERSNGEWTFDRAKQVWSPMVRPVQHVGIPGHQFQTAVMWDGSLALPLSSSKLHVSVGYGERMHFVDRQGTGNPAVRRSLEDGRLPIAHVDTKDGDCLWHETVFAHLLGRRPEQGLTPQDGDLLVTQARFRVQNAGPQAAAVHLWLHFGDTSQLQLGYKASLGSEFGVALAHRFQVPLGMMADRVRYVIPQPTQGQLVWHDEVPAPAGMTRAAKNVVEWQVSLEPGRQAELRLVIPHAPVDRATGGKLASSDFEAQQAEVSRFYRELLQRDSQITTPDAFVNDYLAAVAGQMAQQVAARRDGVWMYKTSPNHYDLGNWPCNAGKALPTFDLRGLEYITRPLLKSFVDLQTDDVRGLHLGAMGRDEKLQTEGYEKRHGFLGNFRGWTANPLLLSHGMGMWALASHFRITRDRQWLGAGKGSPLQAMIDACDWVAVQRRRTMRDENGVRVPHWGLLPAASAHDWLAGNTIFNDAYCIYGMDEIVRLLREISHPRAEELARELNDYRQCLRDRYAAARDRARRVPLADGREIPYVPRIVQELDWAKIDWTYTGYGPLRAGAWGAFDPHDELVDQALAFLEAGMPRGVGHYVPCRSQETADRNWLDISDRQAPRHYLWRHYVEYETMWPIGCHLFLARDDLPRYFEWLFHNLAAVLHHDWRVGVESLDGVPSCAPGDGDRWQALRRMFVNERGGLGGAQQELFLLQAIPRSWIKPGDRLAAERMRSYFGGQLNLEMQVARDGHSVEVSAEWQLAIPPQQIRMRLRSGDGRPLHAAEINGAATPVLAGDTIRLPDAPAGKYRIVGRFAP